MYKRCTQGKQFLKFLFLICSILYLPYNSYGQQNQVLEKTLSLQLKNVTLGDALKALGDKTGLQFSYSSTQLNTQRRVNVDFREKSLRAALSDLLGQELKGLSVSGTQVTIQTSGGKGSIKGMVKTSDGAAAEFVTVGIKGVKSAQVDAKGNYLLKDLEAGKYTLIASFIGLGVQKKEVTVIAGQTVSQDFVLVESNDQLEEVVINGGSTNKFSVKKTTTSAKMPLGNLENPQVYTTIPKTLLTEQMVTEFSMALKNSPGVYKIQGSRGINSEGASYYSMRGFRSEAALMDGVPAQTNGEVDPANIERVELIKGPSGTLFGGAVVSFGGLINIVTKKPVDTLGGDVSFTMGSYGLRRLSVDVYGPADQVDKDKKLLFRMNAAYQDQKSFQDIGFRKSIFFAPSLEYRASKRLNISVNAGFSQLEGTSPSVIFLNRTRNYIAHVPSDLNFDWNRSYTNNDLTMKNPTLNFRGQVTYKLSDQWTSQTIYSINSRKSDGFYQYQFIRGAKDNMMERTLSKQYSINTSRDLQQNFTGDFNLFGLRNRVVIGFDYLNQTVRNNSSPYIVFDSVDGTNPADANYSKINRSAVEAALAKNTGLRTWNNGENNIYGAYASNVLNLSDRLMAMLSLRVDRFQNKGFLNLSNNQRTGQYMQTAISPKFGLVYQVLKDRVSLFGNYMNGFSNVAPATQPEGSGVSSTFKPQQSNQFEGGAKMDLFQGKLSFTASIYDIEVNNMTWREEISVNGKNYLVTLQGGTQKSKGIEFELIANPLEGLNVIAGYAYNDSKLIEGTPALEGRRPTFAGPSTLINSWISYAIPHGDLKGIGLGAGVNYIGKHVTGNSAITGVFTLPSYVMATATVFYDKPKYRLGFKVDNLTDELYFTGTGVLSPQMPRTFAANATFKF